LWCFDLRTNRMTRVYTFPESVVPTTAYLNDVRFDLTHGKAGYAFITDSSAYGQNRLVVLDLATGESRARLVNHESVRSEKKDGMPIVLPTAEGYPLLARPKPGVVARPSLGADGLAIFPVQDRLVWCPLIGRTAYALPISMLVNPTLSDEDLAKQVRAYVQKPASDGLHEARGNVLLATDFEHARVLAYRGTTARTVFQARPYEWPDTLSLGPNGRIYVILNQLQRQKNYHEGKDLRKKPYTLVSFRYR
ncbi:gluconolaconase, partial [bacterium]